MQSTANTQTIPGTVVPAASAAAISQHTPYPLLGQVTVLQPGEELLAYRVFDPAEDLYLRDHTFGRDVSALDPDAMALAVMPMTMSLEILAEAAACLLPALRVIGSERHQGASLVGLGRTGAAARGDGTADCPTGGCT